jgi:hypothetical protein
VAPAQARNSRATEQGHSKKHKEALSTLLEATITLSAGDGNGYLDSLPMPSRDLFYAA